MSIESVMTSNHVIPFSSCLQFCSASGSFAMSQFFTSGGQSFGASVSSTIHITPQGKDSCKFVPGLSADLNLYPFSVVKCDPEYNSSSEFCESFQEFVNLRMYWGSFHNTLPPMEGLSLQLVFTTTPINTLHLQVDYLATKLGLFFPAHKTFSF